MTTLLDIAISEFYALPVKMQNNNCIQDAVSRLRQRPNDPSLLAGFRAWVREVKKSAT